MRQSCPSESMSPLASFIGVRLESDVHLSGIRRETKEPNAHHSYLGYCSSHTLLWTLGNSQWIKSAVNLIFHLYTALYHALLRGAGGRVYTFPRERRKSD